MDTVVTTKRRVGVVGYGNLGKFLVEEILRHDDLELAFVWNRTCEATRNEVDEKYILEDLDSFVSRSADLIVEVAHPSITELYGPKFLEHADYMIGSPTALSAQHLEDTLRKAAVHHGMYVPAGALWGADDIKKMADRGSLKGLKITMTKDPVSFKLCGHLKEMNSQVTSRTVLYDGPVRSLCPLAPNNVNTMAAAALAAHNLGFDKVQGSIVADPGVGDWHVVEVEVWGPGDVAAGTAFHVKTVRRNPAKIGHVTGSATYNSFLSSMLVAHGKGSGVHLV